MYRETGGTADYYVLARKTCRQMIRGDEVQERHALSDATDGSIGYRESITGTRQRRSPFGVAEIPPCPLAARIR